MSDVASTDASSINKKKRRCNFSEVETSTLIESVTKRRKIVLGKLDSTNVTAKLKQHAWEEIKNEVDTVSRVKRTCDELRKKFRDFKTLVKKKASGAKKYATGTGKLFTVNFDDTVKYQ